jgi:GT2 family glycosyltransferase
MDVSIIIVNYNTRKLLRNCIDSIYLQTKNIEFEIILCDNGSTDGSQEMIKKEFPRVILVENNANIGFGAANNKGAKFAKGKYLFLLNSDTILLNNALLLFYDFAEKNKKKLLGCFLRDESEIITHSFENYSRPVPSFIRLAYQSFPFLSKIRSFFMRHVSYVESSYKEVEYITGADIFIENSLFSALNGFDESFFMYFEDDDLCRRARLSSHLSFVISGPKIVHFTGKSSKNNATKLMIIERSFMLYCKKYLSSFSFAWFKCAYMLYAIIRFTSPVFSFSEKKKLFLNIWA